MEHWERHKRVWRFFAALLGGWLRRKFNYTPQIVDEEGPYLVLCNHATDWDPLLLGIAFPKRQMYFVASEHIFRWGLSYKLIDFLLHPIARLKGATAADTVMTVMRRMKKGANVAIFAEGNRTWDGRTGFILPATGKLARSCGGKLITYRLTGGYFTSPRWAGKSLRRGKMTGELVGVYSREELRAMTPERVSEIIDRDLFEDAYARQREEHISYNGKDIAEGLETMLCLCPECGDIGSMRSLHDRFFCVNCGFETRYNSEGFFEGGDAPFDSIDLWDEAQTNRLLSLADAAGEDTVLFSDEGATLDTLTGEPGRHGQERTASGRLSMTKRTISCGDFTVHLDSIGGMGMHGPLGLSFSVEKSHYELSAPRPACLRKYMTVFEHIKQYNKEKEVAVS